MENKTLTRVPYFFLAAFELASPPDGVDPVRHASFNLCKYMKSVMLVSGYDPIQTYPESFGHFNDNDLCVWAAEQGIDPDALKEDMQKEWETVIFPTWEGVQFAISTARSQMKGDLSGVFDLAKQAEDAEFILRLVHVLLRMNTETLLPVSLLKTEIGADPRYVSWFLYKMRNKGLLVIRKPDAVSKHKRYTIGKRGVDYLRQQ